MSVFVGRPRGLSAWSVLALPALLFVAACSANPTAEEEKPKETDRTAPVAPVGPRSWPMFGGTVHRNLAAPNEKNIPGSWAVEKGKELNVKWSVPLGTYAYGGPVIANGRIFVGTDNAYPRDLKVEGDKGILLCLRESDGSLLWQAVHDKLPDAEAYDTPKHGVASSPCVDGDRLYYVSNRCEVVCAEAAGDGKGNARIVWTYDMIKELGVVPCYLANSSPVVVEDLVFALTANGYDPKDPQHKLGNPKAPALVAVDKKTGKLAWADHSPGANVLEGQWSSPAAAKVGDTWQVIYGGGDGWLRGFEAKTGKPLWKFDCNPKKAVWKQGGRGDRNYIVATPVVYDNKVYVGTGQDPDHGSAVGHFWCVDITKKPTNKDLDLSPVNDNFDPKAPENKDSGLVWHYGGMIVPKPKDNEREFSFGRTISTAAIHDDLVYAVELAGFLHCFDAKTGQKYWTADLKGDTWSSPFYVDGKVMIGLENGDLFVFKAGKTLEDPVKIDMSESVKTPAVAVNGVLYVSNGNALFAIAAK
jgi:outer membrane protein assembly factor BamB